MLCATKGGATPHAIVIAIHCSMSSYVLVAAVVLAAIAAVFVVGRCGRCVHGRGHLRHGHLCVVVVTVVVVVTSSLSSLSWWSPCRHLGGGHCGGGGHHHCGGGGRCGRRCGRLRHSCLVVVGVITVVVAVQYSW